MEERTKIATIIERQGEVVPENCWYVVFQCEGSVVHFSFITFLVKTIIWMFPTVLLVEEFRDKLNIFSFDLMFVCYSCYLCLKN